MPRLSAGGAGRRRFAPSGTLAVPRARRPARRLGCLLALSPGEGAFALAIAAALWRVSAVSRPGPLGSWSGERGSATLQLVLVTPAVLVMILTVVHVGLWFDCQHVVTAAAEEGLAAARTEGGTPDAGSQRANQFLDSLAPRLLTDRRVSSTSDGDTAQVSVDGAVADVVPGLHLNVHARAHGSLETFRAP